MNMTAIHFASVKDVVARFVLDEKKIVKVTQIRKNRRL